MKERLMKIFIINVFIFNILLIHAQTFTINSSVPAWQATGISVLAGNPFVIIPTSSSLAAFIAPNGPEAGNLIRAVIYNTNTGRKISMNGNRYYSDNTWFETLGSVTSGPHAWTGLAPNYTGFVLRFVAFVDVNSNGFFNSGIDEYLGVVDETFTISPTVSGELYMAFYDDGPYNDNFGTLTFNHITPPKAINDTICFQPGTINCLNVLSNDTAGSNLINSASIVLHSTFGQGNNVVVPGQGTWHVDNVGILCFTPIAGFSGNPSTIDYIVSDIATTLSNMATVIFMNSYSILIADTICDGNTINFDGTQYSTSGQYTHTYNTQYGCDSILTLNLNVLSNSSSNLTINSCGSYFAPDGQIHTASGIITALVPNSLGCDSIITINLIINDHTSSSIIENVCDSYIAPDGQVYTSSGIKTAIIPNTLGCDSIITINLTVNYSSTSNITEMVCGPYTAPDGQIFTTSGIKTAVVPNISGCDSVIIIDLTVHENISVQIIPDFAEICIGDTVSFFAFTDTQMSEYIWNNGFTSQQIMVCPDSSGYFFVNVEDSNGCTASDTAFVFVYPNPNITIQVLPHEGCMPLTITLNYDVNDSTTYLWDFGDNTNLNGNVVHHTYLNSGIYSINVIATNNFGCSLTYQYPQLINVYPNPLANFYYIPPDDEFFSGLYKFYDSSVGADQLYWNFGNGNTSNLSNPEFYFYQEGTYNVCLQVSNQFGCENDTCKEIIIHADFSLYVPNAFTPNGDGINDLFGPKGIGIDNEHYEMRIYDRWGMLIFLSNNINHQWDGKVIGSNIIAQQGVYTWVITYSKINRNDHYYYEKYGIVTLIK